MRRQWLKNDPGILVQAPAVEKTNRQPPRNDPQVFSPHSAVETIEVLVRGLLTEISNQAAPSNLVPQPGAEEIILDVQVDGARYRLIRSLHKPPDMQNTLSPRELEIARMVAEGYSNKTIAAVLEISSWTVCTHLRRIFAKLGVRTRAAMVARLLKEGSFVEPLQISEYVEV